MNDSANINISQQNVKSSCNSKCAYSFNYPESALTAKNNGYFISITYDNGTIPPVTFNSQKYNVSSIFIFSPSIHTFNNKKAPAEICIEHAPLTGGDNLIVSIPLTSSSASSSNPINQIIQTITQNSPSENETTNININGFTLNNIIPVKPYYYYSESGNSDYIVFNITNAISISNSTMNSLKQIIKPYPIPTPGTELFYNSSGPNTVEKNKLDEGIYISCQPTGNSKETTDVTYEKKSSGFDMSSFWNSRTFQIIIEILSGCIMFIVLFFALNYGYTKFTSGGSGTSTSVQTLTKNISRVSPS